MEGLTFSLGKEEEKVSLEDFYDLVIFGGDLPALRLQFMRQGQESKRSLLKRKKSEARQPQPMSLKTTPAFRKESMDMHLPSEWWNRRKSLGL